MEKAKDHEKAGGLNGWLPIESAPRRRKILVWGRKLDINWRNPGRPGVHFVNAVMIAKEEDEALKAGMYYAQAGEDGKGWEDGIIATHWMPLPDGPKV